MSLKKHSAYLLLVGFAALGLVASGKAGATTVLLGADRSASSNTSAGGYDAWNDNRLRAYNVSPFGSVDGFMRFNLSAIPDNAVITGMSLTLFAEFAPTGTPVLGIRRSSLDTWTRGGTGFPLAFDETLQAGDAGPFPGTSGTPYTFLLPNAGLVDWSTDLADDFLSLVVSEVGPGTNDYMYFFGSDSAGTRPSLEVTYEMVPEPSRSLLMMAGAMLAVLRRRRVVTL